MSNKHNVYLAQVNNSYGRNAFLPFSVGLLQSYALTNEIIKENFDFKGFVYLREPFEEIAKRLENPEVFGISCYIWNWNFSIALARRIKKLYPNCLIVLGGPHVPVRSEGFFQTYPYVDVLVHYEGEVTFSEILLEYLKEKPDYTNVLGTSVNKNGKTIKTLDRPRLDNLDVIPSPYLTGIFDDIIVNENYDFHASQETNRGCIALGTSITTINGIKKIEEITPGEKVLGWDETNQEFIWNTVEKSVCTGIMPTLNIQANDYEIETTEDHPFYTNRGWITAAEINQEDYVLCVLQRFEEDIRNFHWVKVMSITKSKVQSVYDLVNANPYPNFFANNILVHNCPYSCTFCLVGDSKIITDDGEKPLKEIASGDKILGWDENKNVLSWNKVEKLVHNGTKSILKINTGDNYVESTADHEFYTKRGWKIASELQQGDELLSLLRDEDANSEEILFKSLPNETQQSHEKEGSCKETVSDIKKEYSEWPIRTLDVYKRGQETNWQNCQNQTVKLKKSNETTCNCKTSRGDKQHAEFGDNISQNETRKSHEKSEISCESCWSIERSDHKTKIHKELHTISEPTSKWLREKNNCFSGENESTLQVCGRFSNMDQTTRLENEQESRLHSHYERNEESNTCTRNILASRSKRGSKRARALSESEVGLFHNLGTRATRRTNEQQNNRIHWTKIDSIETTGEKEVFDLFNVTPSHNFFANGILVSNCDWGSNTLAKIKPFGTERLINEITWFAQRQIDLLYNCDANFGILRRDIPLTKDMVNIKKQYGFPNKFRAAYAKNSNDVVFEIAEMLNESDMNKGITLSFQSMDENTLEIVKRKNIKIDNFKDLMKRYRMAGIATYSEIIIGLPGETYETFANGLDLLINCGQHDSIQCYNCELLPNSEMNEPAYREKYGIRDVKVPVLFFHGTPSIDPYQEYYDLIIGTSSLPQEDWLKCHRFAWAIQCFHCLSLTQLIAVFCRNEYEVSYRKFYEKILAYADQNPESIIGKTTSLVTELFKGIIEGKEWGIIDERFGNIVWPPEEGGFLKIIVEKDKFYAEIYEMLKDWLPQIPDAILTDVITYQKNIIIDPNQNKSFDFMICHELSRYFHEIYLNNRIEIKQHLMGYRIESNKNYNGDLESYAREIVWYGRKGGAFKHSDIQIINEFPIAQSPEIVDSRQI